MALERSRVKVYEKDKAPADYDSDEIVKIDLSDTYCAYVPREFCDSINEEVYRLPVRCKEGEAVVNTFEFSAMTFDPGKVTSPETRKEYKEVEIDFDKYTKLRQNFKTAATIFKATHPDIKEDTPEYAAHQKLLFYASPLKAGEASVDALLKLDEKTFTLRGAESIPGIEKYGTKNNPAEVKSAAPAPSAAPSAAAAPMPMPVAAPKPAAAPAAAPQQQPEKLNTSSDAAIAMALQRAEEDAAKAEEKARVKGDMEYHPVQHPRQQAAANANANASANANAAAVAPAPAANDDKRAPVPLHLQTFKYHPLPEYDAKDPLQAAYFGDLKAIQGMHLTQELLDKTLFLGMAGFQRELTSPDEKLEETEKTNPQLKQSRDTRKNLVRHLLSLGAKPQHKRQIGGIPQIITQDMRNSYLILLYKSIYIDPGEKDRMDRGYILEEITTQKRVDGLRSVLNKPMDGFGGINALHYGRFLPDDLKKELLIAAFNSSPDASLDLNDFCSNFSTIYQMNPSIPPSAYLQKNDFGELVHTLLCMPPKEFNAINQKKLSDFLEQKRTAADYRSLSQNQKWVIIKNMILNAPKEFWGQYSWGIFCVLPTGIEQMRGDLRDRGGMAAAKNSGNIDILAMEGVERHTSGGVSQEPVLQDKKIAKFYNAVAVILSINFSLGNKNSDEALNQLCELENQLKDFLQAQQPRPAAGRRP